MNKDIKVIYKDSQNMKDIEITSEGLNYTYTKLMRGIWFGIQTNKEDSSKAREICDKIAELILELRRELDE